MGSVPNQILPSGQQPYVQQANFGQVMGRVLGYNPSCDVAVVQNLINNVARRYYDRRLWYGLFTKGQIVAPGYYATGTATVTLGSPTVTGTGTAWTASMVGQQFRQGFTSPIYTIIAVNVGLQTLTLELPWGSPSQANIGYFITQIYYSFPNIKYFYSVKNLLMMYRMWTNVPQSLIENWDPSRLQYLYPRVVATLPPDTNGNYQVELWPAPNTQQAFPYLAYVQPPSLKNDTDNFAPFVRTDIVELGAIAEVLLHKPKQNEAYSESMAMQVSERMSKMFEMELQHVADADETLYRQDIVTMAEQFPYADINPLTGALQGGAFSAAMMAVSVDDY